MQFQYEWIQAKLRLSNETLSLGNSGLLELFTRRAVPCRIHLSWHSRKCAYKLYAESTHLGKVEGESHNFLGNLPPSGRLSHKVHSASRQAAIMSSNCTDFHFSFACNMCTLGKLAAVVVCSKVQGEGRDFPCTVFFRNYLQKWGQGCCTLLRRRA